MVEKLAKVEEEQNMASYWQVVEQQHFGSLKRKEIE